MKPLVIINLKTYKQGDKVLELAKIIEKVDKKIIVGVQPEDVAILSKKTNLSIYSQHVDYQEPGRNTGFILPEGIKAVGAKGVFLNHSEHRLDFKIIKKTVLHCKKVKLKYPFIVGAGIKTNDDLKIAMKLGARGIAVSSAITQARNPEKSLREMVGK